MNAARDPGSPHHASVWPRSGPCSGPGHAPSARAEAAAGAASTRGGRGRRAGIDRDLDGKIDDPGAAVLDAAWPRLADAVLTPVLGPLVPRLAALHATKRRPRRRPARRTSRAGTATSTRTCERCSSSPCAGPYSRRYCGGGGPRACRDALWGAIDAAAAELEAAQGPAPLRLARGRDGASGSGSRRASCRTRCAGRTARPSSSSCRSPGTAPAERYGRASVPSLARLANRHDEKRYLMAPGPTPVPPEVLAAGARAGAPPPRARLPRAHDCAASAGSRRCAARRTTFSCFTASGSGAFESAVVNLLSPGERVLVVSAGEFGERWARLAPRTARTSTSSATPGARPRSRTTFASRSTRRAPRSSSSSTPRPPPGVVADVQALAGPHADAGALTVVDAVSSLGAVPLETDAWGLDVVVAGSQKALMTPPGLSLSTVSPARLGAGARTTTPRFYFDWAKLRSVARDGHDAVHAGGLARRRARRRARAAARGGAGGSVRAPRRARSRLPRGREGDGARALLARRGALRDRHRDPHAGRRRRARARARAARPLRDHGRRAATASSASGCSGSATSATTTCSTSRPRSRRSRRCSSSAARSSSAAPASRARSRRTARPFVSLTPSRPPRPRPGADRRARARAAAEPLRRRRGRATPSSDRSSATSTRSSSARRRPRRSR